MTRRKWLSSMAAGAHAMLLLSCGSDDEERQAPEREPSTGSGGIDSAAKEPQELSLAFLDTPLAVTPAQNAIAQWNRGNIAAAAAVLQLRESRVPFQPGMKDFLASREAGGVPVDLAWLPILADIPELFKSGLIAPLDRWLQFDANKPLEAFAEEARRLVGFRAQTMALPIAVAPGVLAHNALRFRNANLQTPTHEWTWDDFIAAAIRLTEDTNGDGAINRWGFVVAGYFPDWLPFLLQDGGMIADLESGEVGLDGPESRRAIGAWDELGRVHGIHPYGPDTTVEKLLGYDDFYQRGMYFSPFNQRMPEHWRAVTPLPMGAQNTTPLALLEALAIPAAADGTRAYEVLIPLAHWWGERRSLPAVSTGWQYIRQPDREHFDLVFPELARETALHALATAKASHVASSPYLSQGLFNIITYRLARDEVGIEQAIDQATNWLQNYVNE